MKVSDYIVEFLIDKGVTDVFGYPGGMVTHLMSSFDKYKEKISAHVNYHEQASSFAACGYAQASAKLGVAYATSGPGATNMITGICNAYFDSIPVLFITGQVNTYESKDGLRIRQRGFQETDIVSIVKNITKYVVRIDSAQDIVYELEKAYFTAMSGRKGPVLLDIPMDVQRQDIDPLSLKIFEQHVEASSGHDTYAEKIYEQILLSSRPCIIIGAGVRSSGMTEIFKRLAEKLSIPVVASMIAIDILPTDALHNFGFIGAYGKRSANFIVSKADLVISFGSRLDIRQTGANVDYFAPNAKLIRVDVDYDELSRKIKDDEYQIAVDLKNLLPALEDVISRRHGAGFESWIKACNILKDKLDTLDEMLPNILIKKIGLHIPESAIITTDVGQNQVWVPQSLNLRRSRVLFSGGHGAMGYSLPAAIGAYFAYKSSPVICFNGDGGIQMNIQELEFISRERVPIKIIILNNSSLGMIRHFQEMYFDSNYFQTKKEQGYTVPSFEKIASAYGIDYSVVNIADDITSELFADAFPRVIDVKLNEDTYVFPKLAYDKPCYDQDPSLKKEFIATLTNMLDELAPIKNGGGGRPSEVIFLLLIAQSFSNQSLYNLQSIIKSRVVILLLLCCIFKTILTITMRAKYEN